MKIKEKLISVGKLNEDSTNEELTTFVQNLCAKYSVRFLSVEMHKDLVDAYCKKHGFEKEQEISIEEDDKEPELDDTEEDKEQEVLINEEEIKDTEKEQELKTDPINEPEKIIDPVKPTNISNKDKWKNKNK